MHLSTAKRLLDASTAVERILRYAAGRSFAEYEQDDYFRSAVERQFEILAEALNAASRAEPELSAWIPELPVIVGLRNKIAHGYDTVDDQIVWDTVQHDLPGLHLNLAQLLSNAPPPSSEVNDREGTDADDRHH